MTEDEKITEIQRCVKAKCDEYGFDFFLLIKPSITALHTDYSDEHKLLGVNTHCGDIGVWWEVR
jgi:hypothetical protein